MIELHPDGFRALLPPLRAVPINHLFARSVLERYVDGRVWVDREVRPSLCHVVHPYGMTLLFGDLDHADPTAVKTHFGDCRRCSHDQWMQATPEALALAIGELLDADVPPADRPPGGPRVQRYTRTNFRFDPALYARGRAARPPLARGTIRPLTPDEFALDDISVSPHRFWRDADQFFAHGGGLCVEQDGQLAAMAFSSFRFDRQLEIGVETRADYRRRGYAYHAASAMVDQCLAQGLEPVWSCRKENSASYELAQSLGFEPSIDIPYYRLPHVGEP